MSHKTKADRQREAKERQKVFDLMKEIDRNTEDLLLALENCDWETADSILSLRKVTKTTV